MNGEALPPTCDVAIIGAGLGGLTAAALLAKAGMSVCVLETDARPGGYLVGFEREGYRFDTAILWLNQCGPGGSVRRVLDLVGPSAPQTPPLQRIRRMRGESFDYLLTHRPDDLRDQLVADFPAQRQGLHDFFAAARSVGAAMNGLVDYMRARETWSAWDYLRGLGAAKHGLKFLRYLGASAEIGLQRFFSDARLRRLFCTEERLLSCLVPIGWAYAGDYQAPPAGGSRAIPEFLCRAIGAWDGKVGFRCRVTEVLLEGRRAVGVRYVDGRDGGAPRELRSRYVIAACDLEMLYERALPPGTIDAGLLGRLRGADLYPSSVSVWLGLDRPAQELGFGEELVFLTRDEQPRALHNSTDPLQSALSVVAPSCRDPSVAPPGKGSLTISVAADIAFGDQWRTGADRSRGPAYREFKKGYVDALIDRVARALCPQLREHVELCEAATPITHWRYTGNRDGTIMGATPTRANIRAGLAHYRTPIQNLLLGGHWAEYGGGVPVAVRAGSNSALIVLQRERPQAFAVMREVMDGRLAPEAARGGGLRELPDAG